MSVRLSRLKIQPRGERNAQHCNPLPATLMRNPSHFNETILRPVNKLTRCGKEKVNTLAVNSISQPFIRSNCLN